MQPTVELTLRRPWNWGIAILGDPDSDVPDVDTESLVTVGPGTVIFAVRNARDIEPQQWEEHDPPHATTSTVHIRVIDHLKPHGRPLTLCDVVLDTPSQLISLGDALSEITINELGPTTRVVASTTSANAGG